MLGNSLEKHLLAEQLEDMSTLGTELLGKNKEKRRTDEHKVSYLEFICNI